MNHLSKVATEKNLVYILLIFIHKYLPCFFVSYRNLEIFFCLLDIILRLSTLVTMYMNSLPKFNKGHEGQVGLSANNYLWASFIAICVIYQVHLYDLNIARPYETNITVIQDSNLHTYLQDWRCLSQSIPNQELFTI